MHVGLSYDLYPDGFTCGVENVMFLVQINVTSWLVFMGRMRTHVRLCMYIVSALYSVQVRGRSEYENRFLVRHDGVVYTLVWPKKSRETCEWFIAIGH